MAAAKLQLYGVGRAPKTIPMWSMILEDLGWPDEPALMRVLGVECSDLREWNRSGKAPKWACLALFWLTRWGRQEVHQAATEDALMAVQLLRSVERERDRLAEVVSVMRNGLAELGLVGAPESFCPPDRLASVEVSGLDGPAPGPEPLGLVPPLVVVGRAGGAGSVEARAERLRNAG